MPCGQVTEFTDDTDKSIRIISIHLYIGIAIFMAHTKSAGSTKYGRDSQPKYLGVKKYAGEKVKTGDIVVRQRGSKVLAGEGVGRGSDDTLFALRPGMVRFQTVRKIRFDGTKRYAKRISVVATP